MVPVFKFVTNRVHWTTIESAVKFVAISQKKTEVLNVIIFNEKG